MDNNENKSRGAWGAAAILAAVAAVAGALSMYIVWYGDALLYQFSFATGEPLRGVADIPASMCSHFLNQNGRIVAHTLVQIFCGGAGQTAFAVCNALVWAALVALLVRYGGGSLRQWRLTAAAALLTLFFCDTSYIPPHQIGYIWMSCTALLFLIVYERADRLSVLKGWAAWPLLFLFGLVCGNGNESIDLGIGAALCIDAVMRRRDYGWRRLTLLAGFCLGVAVLCLSPGQMTNAASSYRPPLVLSLYNFAVSLRAFWVFAVILAVALVRRKVALRRFVADNRLMLTAMAVMAVFNISVTVKGNRQLFGIELYSAVLTLRLLRRFRISAVWLAVATVVVAVQYYMKFITLADFNSDERELRRQLTERGNAPIYIDLIHHNPYVHPTEELSYHDCVNLTFHVAACADDINGRGSFYSRHVNDAMEFIDSVALYPAALADIERLDRRNRVIDCGGGVYMLLRLRENPARFELHRSLDIPGFRRPLPPVEISFDASQHPSTDVYDVFVSSFPYPLMHVDSVVIK